MIRSAHPVHGSMQVAVIVKVADEDFRPLCLECITSGVLFSHERSHGKTSFEQFIAELIHEDFSDIPYARFQEIVGELKRERILQGKTTLFIAPKLLHVHLWTQFWELICRRVAPPSSTYS